MWQGYLPTQRRLVHSKIRRHVRKAPREIFQNDSGGKKLASRFPVSRPARLHSCSCEHDGGHLVWLLDPKHCRRLSPEYVEKLSWAIQVQHSAHHRQHAAHRCKTDALQDRPQSNGQGLRRCNHPANLHLWTVCATPNRWEPKTISSS